MLNILQISEILKAQKMKPGNGIYDLFDKSCANIK